MLTFVKGVRTVWKQIINSMNNELRNCGIGVKHLKDYETSIALIVRRTFGISNMREVDYNNTDIESFVAEIVSIIKSRKESENGLHQS